MNALNEATRSNGVFKATLLHKDHNKMTIKLHQSAISLRLNGVKLQNMSSIFVIIQINCAKSEKKITNLSTSVAIYIYIKHYFTDFIASSANIP